MKVFLSALMLALSILPLFALPDLDVAYISRTPRYDRYHVSYQYGIDPNDYWAGKPYLSSTEQKWPNPGQTVTFTAVIKNPGNAATGSFAYRWYFDGQLVKSGTLSSIAAGGQTTTTYTWTWDSEQNTHYIKFVADPDNLIAEDIETNNSREDPTNALSFRFHVWQSLYNWFRTNARNYAPHIASWDDWAQQQIYWMNKLLADSVYPHAPNGCLERVRLDDIVIESDSTPDPGGTHAPNDWQWDGRWGFTNGYLGPPNFYEQNPSVLQTYEGSLIHELSHQIGLIDLYVLNCEIGMNRIVTNHGHPNTREGGMMTGSYDRYSDHSVYALNSHLHKRRGFYGEYLYDLPTTCRVRVVDAYYRPLAGATLTFYQDKDRNYDPPAKFTITTDSNGYATLPNRTCYGSITTATGHTLHDNPWGLINVVGANAVFFVQIQAAGQVDYQYMEILPFNIAYWCGLKDVFTYDLQANIVPEGRPTTANLYGVKMANHSKGYAVGAGGRILQWNGTTWNAMSSGVSSDLYAVDVYAPTGLACAVGAGGTVLINSGSGWVKKNLGITTNLRACAVVSPTVILVGGEGGALYRSTNGGTSWNKITVSGATNTIKSIKFVDSSNGIFVGFGPMAYYTTNGGANWYAASGTPSNWIYDCAFPALDEAWACTDGGPIALSANGGRNWVTKYPWGYPEPWYAIDMLAGATGWAVGRYHSFYNTTTIKRFEKGQFYNQALVTFDTTNELYDISMVSENEAWIVGKGGVLMRMLAQNLDSYQFVNIAQARMLPDGAAVVINGGVVTGVYPGEVYVEDQDRTAGIKVITTSSISMHRRTRVTGIMGTENGERVVRFGDVADIGSASAITPLGLTSDKLAGRSSYTGVNNVGLLVKVAGNVTASGDGWFTIDNGSLVRDRYGNAGVKVRCDGITPPSSGFKLVTGISTLEVVDGVKFPVLRVRGSSDIQDVQ